METFRDFFTVKEAAEFLGVTPTTLRNWDRGKKLIPVRHPLNGYRLYRRADLERLLRSLEEEKG
jgi:DNA-binding transcriptional MerR regulator